MVMISGTYKLIEKKDTPRTKNKLQNQGTILVELFKKNNNKVFLEVERHNQKGKYRT